MAATMEMLQKLQKKITCGICRNYFSQPVTIRCGHSFCQTCLSFFWEVGPQACFWPECRQMSEDGEFPAINEQLAQLTDLGKELCSQLLQSSEGGNHCTTHNQVLKVFCEEDQTLLCWRCCQTPEHGDHKLSPIEEAAHSCREKLQNIQSHLWKGLEDAEKLLVQEDKCIGAWNWMMTEEYQKLHHFLMEEEYRCHERIREEQKTSQDRIYKHIQTLQSFIQEAEEAENQPNLDLLQEVKPLLGRCTSVLSQSTKAVIPELRVYPIPGMIEMLRRFQVDINLDPASASPCLIISKDLKSVKAGEGWQGDIKKPELSDCHSVLAEQAFSSGRHYWEVDVTQLPQWILGIYTPHFGVTRHTDVDLNAFMFLIRCIKKEDDYIFQSFPGSLNHRVKGPVTRIGVYLEYTPSTVVFYNVLQHSIIYRFHSIPFTAPVTPIFSPGPPVPGIQAGAMTLCSVDSPHCSGCYSSLSAFL
ncbi:tripartite motif-containing protein 64-like [Macrotis lagotis]|uniref:tripartite motif-containing protein 64-like n=1 Tax=Macrotis lagotis TaxID=92651 RepID=UPI003D68F5CE